MESFNDEKGLYKSERLHEFIYEVVNEICYDREYTYLLFVKNLYLLMDEIYKRGTVSGNGEYIIPGIKSNMCAIIKWQIAHRVNYTGPNTIKINCTLEKKPDGERMKAWEKNFELSSGESFVEAE